MRRGLWPDKHKENFVTKGTISHGGGAISSGLREGTGDFSFAEASVGGEAVQGSVSEITAKTKQKSLSFFLFVCTLENYLHNFF